MNTLADITIRSLLSSGLALALGIFCLVSTSANASEWHYQLNESGIDNLRATVTPLMTFKVSAGAGEWNNDTLDISDSYTGVGYNGEQSLLGYTRYSRNFNVSSPINSLDFSEAIKARCELSPQKMLEKMIINQGVGFNLNW